MYIKPNLSFITKVGMEVEKLMIKVDLVEEILRYSMFQIFMYYTQLLTHIQ